MLDVAFGDEPRVQSEALPARDWEGQGEELSEFDSSFDKKSEAQAISSQDSQKKNEQIHMLGEQAEEEWKNSEEGSRADGMQPSPTGLASLKQAVACENDSTEGNQLLLHGRGIPRSDPAEHVHVLDKLAVD